VYCAVITLCPFAKVVVDTVAVDSANVTLEFETPVTVAGLPNATPLRKNCTVPVGSCEALAMALLCGAATVAVSVTFAPTAAVVGLAATDVVVAALETVTTSVPDVLPLKLLSPAYTALMLCVPTGSWIV
jgi:hypothetical protein